jgi:hypothetical protein
MESTGVGAVIAVHATRAHSRPARHSLADDMLSDPGERAWTFGDAHVRVSAYTGAFYVLIERGECDYVLEQVDNYPSAVVRAAGHGLGRLREDWRADPSVVRATRRRTGGRRRSEAMRGASRTLPHRGHDHRPHPGGVRPGPARTARSHRGTARHGLAAHTAHRTAHRFRKRERWAGALPPGTVLRQMATTFDPPGWTPDVIPVTVDGKLLVVVRVDPDSVPRPLFHQGSVRVRLDGRNTTASRSSRRWRARSILTCSANEPASEASVAAASTCPWNSWPPATCRTRSPRPCAT